MATPIKAVKWTFYTDELSAALKRRAAMSRQSRAEIALNAAKIFTRIGTIITPPTQGKGNPVGDFPAQKLIGERAIARQLNKIFFGKSRNDVAKYGETEFSFVSSFNGKRYVCRQEYNKQALGVAGLRALHIARRGKYGDVRALSHTPFRNLGNNTYEIRKYVVDAEVLEQYMLHEFAQVGKGKAAWVRLNKLVGGKFQAASFIRRHIGAMGVRHDYRRLEAQAYTRIELANLTPHIQLTGAKANVIRNAMRLTINAVNRMLEATRLAFKGRVGEKPKKVDYSSIVLDA